MTFQFRPAVREATPLIIGIAGPTTSGKTYSAHRLAAGLANGKEIVMLNAEGARGHQYANDPFKYTGCDLVPPYRYTIYEEALREAVKRKPGAIIIDSMSHAHDGPGGALEWHEEELDRMAGNDRAKRDRCNFSAWIIPKQAENAFRYALLETPCPMILCMRAKEKIKIIGGKPVEQGWQPIVGEGLSFETLFTLTLPPFCKGVPSKDESRMRSPFDTIVNFNKPIDEDLGRKLAAWAAGGVRAESPHNKTAALAAAPGPSEIGPTKTWEGAIKAVTQNTKTRTFAIETADGKAIKTASESLAKSAKGFASTGELVILTLDEAGWANGIDPAIQPPDEAMG